MLDKVIVVHRTLSWKDKKIHISVSNPLPKYRSTDWYCWLNIKLLPGKRICRERVRGTDAWHAVSLAMWCTQRIVEERFPDAYLFRPGEGMGFDFTVLLTLPNNYSIKLRNHLEHEAKKKEIELGNELRQELNKMRSKGQVIDWLRRVR